jgi:hypothetical protein
LLLVNKIFLPSLIAMLWVSSEGCKNTRPAVHSEETKQEAIIKKEEVAVDPKSMDDANNFTRGKVSLELKKDGCNALVIAQTEDGEEIVLIPKTSLGLFEEDGKKIKFHYRVLRMPQPAGCSKGMPAELTDITAD